MTEKKIDDREFAPSSITPSDSWDDPVHTKTELLTLTFRTISANLRQDHPHLARIGEFLLMAGSGARIALRAPGAVITYFREAGRDPEPGSILGKE